MGKILFVHHLSPCFCHLLVFVTWQILKVVEDAFLVERRRRFWCCYVLSCFFHNNCNFGRRVLRRRRVFLRARVRDVSLHSAEEAPPFLFVSSLSALVTAFDKLALVSMALDVPPLHGLNSPRLLCEKNGFFTFFSAKKACR